MADYRPIVTAPGERPHRLLPSERLEAGAGVIASAGAVLALVAAGFGVQLGAGDGLSMAAGTGAADFSGGSGAFKTTTGAVTIGPGAVTVSGAASFTAGGTALSVATNATITGTAAIGTVKSGTFKAADGTAAFTIANSTGAVTFQGAIVAGGDLTVTGNLVVNGNTTTVNSTVVDIADRVVHVNHSTGANDPIPSAICGWSVHRGAVGGVARDHAGIFWVEGSSLFRAAFNTVGDDTTVGANVGFTAGAITATAGLTVSSLGAGVAHLSSGGAFSSSLVSLTADVTGILPVANGGTGVGTLANHGVLLGQGTGNIAATAAMTDGQLLVGQSTADPLPKTLSGDATLAATGALTLATTGVTATSYGDASHVATFTVDAKGRLTAAASPSISLTNANLQAGSYTNITGVGTLTAGTWNGTTIAVAYGGTGQTALTAHYVLIGAGTSAVGLLAPGTSGYPLLSQGAAADPAYGQVDLTAAVTGVLPVANGGTGLSSLTATRIPYGNGTSAFQSSANLTFDGSTLTLSGALTQSSGAFSLSGNADSTLTTSAASKKITITAGAASTWSTAAGALTIDGFVGIAVKRNGTLYLDVASTSTDIIVGSNGSSMGFFAATTSSGVFDWSGSTGQFKTSTGPVSLKGDTTVSAGKNFSAAAGASAFSWSSATGDFTFPTGSISWSGALNKTASFTQGATTDGSAPGTAHLIKGGVHTNISNAEAFLLDVDPSSSIKFTGGSATIALMRNTFFRKATYNAVSPSLTITDAATVAIEDAPQRGATNPPNITRPYALWVQAGLTQLDGGLKVTNASTTIDPGTTGTVTIGDASGTGTLTFGNSTATSTIEVGTGALASGNQQTVNICATNITNNTSAYRIINIGTGTGGGTSGSSNFAIQNQVLIGKVQSAAGYTAVAIQGDYIWIGKDGSNNPTGSAIGFFGQTPAGQQSSTGNTGFVGNSGTAMNSGSTSTGGTGSKAYTFNDVVRAMKNLGLMASS